MNILQQAYLLASAINILPDPHDEFLIHDVELFQLDINDFRCCAGCCAPCQVLMDLKSSGELDRIFSEAYSGDHHWASSFSWWQDDQVSLEYLQKRIILECELCRNA